MPSYWLTFTLKSDATFGSGDGVAGFIDREVERDADGLPFLRGRTLKGLLCEEADNLLYLLGVYAEGESSIPSALKRWVDARNALFGVGGSTLNTKGVMHFGRAQLPAVVRKTVAEAIHLHKTLQPDQALASLTGIRRQTAVDPGGVPSEGSLRSMRVVLRETPFEAWLDCREQLTADQETLLAAAVLAFRRAGTGRNRGRGRLRADLLNVRGDSILLAGYERFVQEAIS